MLWRLYCFAFCNNYATCFKLPVPMGGGGVILLLSSFPALPNSAGFFLWKLLSWAPIAYFLFLHSFSPILPSLTLPHPSMEQCSWSKRKTTDFEESMDRLISTDDGDTLMQPSQWAPQNHVLPQGVWSAWALSLEHKPWMQSRNWGLGEGGTGCQD